MRRLVSLSNNVNVGMLLLGAEVMLRLCLLGLVARRGHLNTIGIWVGMFLTLVDFFFKQNCK